MDVDRPPGRTAAGGSAASAAYWTSLVPVEEQDRNPWDQLPNETGKAYAAFLAYRDLGVGRTAADVARHFQKSPELMRRWRKTHSWDERVAAWDGHLAGARDMAWLEATVATPTGLAAMNQRHLAVLQQIQQKAILRLEQLQVADLGVAVAFQWLMQAIAQERQVYGQLPEEAHGEEADQDAVVSLLSNPATRKLATQLAQAAGHASPEGKAS